jgi:hypothetical protein
MKNLREYRKQNNMCINCGKIKDREGYYCTVCNEKYNKLKHKYTLKHHTEGKCSNCGNILDRNNNKGEAAWFCSECTKKLRHISNSRSAIRRSNSLCVQCGVYVDGYSYCQKCRDERMDRYYKKKNMLNR